MLVLKLRKNDELKVYTPKEKCTLQIQDLIVKEQKFAKIKWNSQNVKAISLNTPQTQFGVGTLGDYFVYFSILKITPSRLKIGIESSGECLVYRKELAFT